MKIDQIGKRTYLVLVVGLIGAAAFYYFGFKKTWDIYQANAQYQLLQEASLKKQEQLPHLTFQFKEMQATLERHQSHGVGEILTTISINKSIYIRSFELIDSLSTAPYQLDTYKISIESDFSTLLKFLKSIESEVGIIPVSVNFYAEENKRTKKKQLIADLYFRFIRINQ